MTVRVLFLRVILPLDIHLLQEARAVFYLTAPSWRRISSGLLLLVVDHSGVHRRKWDGFLVVGWMAVKMRMKPCNQWCGLGSEVMEVEEYKFVL